MFVVATSEHPVAAHAVAECAGVLFDQHPDGFSAALCMVSMRFGGAIEDITDAFHELLGAECVRGVVSRGVLMGSRLGLGSPAVAVLAATGSEMKISGVVRPDDLPGRTDRRLHNGGAGTDNRALIGRVSQKGALRIVLPATPRGGELLAVEFYDERVVSDGSEFPKFGGSAVGVVPIYGVAELGREVVVTAVSAGQVVAIDELPAAALFESLILASPEDALDGVTEVGFTAADGGQFIAVRASSLGLVPSIPVSPGSKLVPAVRGPRSALAQVGRHLDECATGAALVILDEEVLGQHRPSGPSGIERPGSLPLAGVTAGGVLYDEPSTGRLRSPRAVVVTLPGRHVV